MPPKIQGEYVVEYRRGKEPFKRVFNAGVEQSVKPGTYEVRAQMGVLKHRGTVEAISGESVQVRVVLRSDG